MHYIYSTKENFAKLFIAMACITLKLKHGGTREAWPVTAVPKTYLQGTELLSPDLLS